ncbi:glycerate kinase [uncultured Porticoccus sp.]|uniref:glycerate kinase type-2 family protein n=1 Tax=uncultured Porticoccus sp. TaxID=1256050 RepID=UPI0030DA905C|tara:strand:+ start:3916 stop:5205 length:1290 start_codon:yes stop_codon:yes gene_type:complete
MNIVDPDPRTLLTELFYVAVATAQPTRVLADFLPENRAQSALVIGAGKAACSMASCLEQHWSGPLRGLVVTAYGHSQPLQRIEVIEAGHPVPDAMGERAAKRILALVANLDADDLVICLISGGGSSLLALPATGISLADKQGINRALLKSGATIDEINRVRKHLSAIKGGRLGLACTPARLLTLAVSDVPGNDSATIASGPTTADPSTSSEALSILHKYRIPIPETIAAWLKNPDSETPKPGDSRLSNHDYRIIASAGQSLEAAARQAQQAGFNTLLLGDDITGESRDVARKHAALALTIAKGNGPVSPPCVILSGGETVVTVRGNGKGGRNGEYLLALANTLRGASGIYALAADTDGIDGTGDNAGAILSPETWQRARERGWDISKELENNNCYPLFRDMGDLLITGPTRTNVNDFRAILIMPSETTL